MLLIYTTSSTPRLRYTFDLIFRYILGIDYLLTQNVEEFINSTQPKLNYSDKDQFADEMFFYASGFLFEKGIRRQEISVFDWDDTKVFFATHPKYTFPF